MTDSDESFNAGAWARCAEDPAAEQYIDEDDRGQTDIRRWIAHIDQANRMFCHHPDSEPESPETMIEEATDDELDRLEGEF